MLTPSNSTVCDYGMWGQWYISLGCFQQAPILQVHHSFYLVLNHLFEYLLQDVSVFIAPRHLIIQ